METTQAHPTGFAGKAAAKKIREARAAQKQAIAKKNSEALKEKKQDYEEALAAQKQAYEEEIAKLLGIEVAK